MTRGASRTSGTIGTRGPAEAIDAVLRAAVDSGAVPNAVAVAADDRDVIYEGAAGPLAVSAATAVGPDSTFRIASMTKAVTAVAALQLRDRGDLDLDAPVATYYPDFALVQVLDGFDGDEPRLRAPATRATVRQLLTHTAGLPYGFWSSDIVRWEAAGGPASAPSGLEGAFASPMVADPGTRFDYGVSFDWLGLVIEAVSGRDLDAHLADHVFAPLGMRSTGFRIDDDQRRRCVPVHTEDPQGGWAATDIDWDPAPRRWPGGHGLYSTPRDYLRFQRMLLGGGTFAGTTVLDRRSAREMFTNQIGDLGVPAELPTANPAWSSDFVIGTGRKWGWGLLVETEAQPGRRAAGSGSWAGIFNTHFWVDPRTGITGALHTQCLPFVAPEVMRVYADVERAVYASSKTSSQASAK
jgi:CubicO group peptidase (beta-lactamase class C family)